MPKNKPQTGRRRQPRNRQQNRTRNGRKNLGTRTAAQTANNLMMPAKTKKRIVSSSLYDSMYAKCRLDPFSASGSMGIPDGIAARRIVIDHRSFTTIAVANAASNFDILILPTLPYQAIMRTPTPVNVSIDGSFGVAGAANAWIPINIPPEYLTLARIDPSNFAIGQNPYESMSARIVTVGFKLTYIGKPIDASGTLLASSCPVTFGNPDERVVATINGVTYNFAGAVNYTNVNARFIEPSINNSPVNESVFTRVDLGCKGVLKTLQPVSTIKQWIPDKVLLVDATTNTPLVNRIASGGLNTEGAMSFYDERFQPILISATGLGVGTSVLLEVITCMEYFPEPSSTFARLAKSNTKTNDRTIKAVEQVLGSCPAVQTLREPSPFNKFINVISRTSKTIAPMLGPYAPVANAIGAISEGLGELSL